MQIKAVIFDFGGVVVNESFQDWISEHIAPYETIKHEMVQLQDKVDRGDLPVVAYNEYLSKRTGKDPKEIENEIIQNYTVHPEVVSLIELLRKKGIKTAIISNFPNEWFKIIRKRLHFEHLFDEIFVSSTLGIIKPQAEFFNLVLQKLDAKPEETIFTDDKDRYVLAAKQLGIHAVVFTSEKDLFAYLQSMGVL